jgi:signal transduction histidine kinase
MDRLIHDLLEYSRLSRADLPLTAVPLADALKTAIHTVREEVVERHGVISIEGPAPLVRANWSVLVQVFVNLLSNALKFSTRAPRVRIRIEPLGERVRVSFEDNGIGVAAQHHDRIFDVFERLHGAEAYPGTGIGLAIVREGVERLGGRVGLESQEGAGSKFWVELPPAKAA